MILEKLAIEKKDLSFYKEQFNNFTYLSQKNQHYRLLVYLTEYYDNIVILDVGTESGHSCLALSQNKKNKIYTYDIRDLDINYITDIYDNVQKKVLDFKLEKDSLIEEAFIIFLDIDPHDGEQEKIIYNKICNTKFKGILICDDIFLNNGMKEFWNSVNKEKIDITEVGHFSGTGIINFTDEKIEIQ